MSWIPTPAGFEPGTAWSEVGNSNHSVTWTLQTRSSIHVQLWKREELENVSNYENNMVNLKRPGDRVVNYTVDRDVKHQIIIIIINIVNLFTILICIKVNCYFYIVKLGFTGVNIIFLISAQNIDCGYSVVEAVLTSIHNLCFEQKYEKYQNFFIWKFSFFGDEIFSIFE